MNKNKKSSSREQIAPLVNIAYDEKYSDFVLVVKKQEFKVHRHILGARSPFFDTMFTTYMREAKDKKAIIDEVEVDTFKEFLIFVYTGQVSPAADKLAMELYEAAHRFQVDGLKDICAAKIKISVTKENAVKIYEFAVLYDLEGTIRRDIQKVIIKQVLQIENLDYQLDLSVNDVQQLCSARIKAKNAKAVADLAEKKYATLLTRLGFMNYINVDEDY